MIDYYGQPALKRPHWEWNVVLYLFLGGVMGGSAILGAIAREPELRRTAKTTAFMLSAVCPAILISHLGRPERFYKMLRVVKLKSPMSLGVWGLMKFSGLSGISLLLERSGRRSAFFDFANAIIGAFICGYTGVLLSATANPLWGKGKVHIPAMCVASGIAGACALNAALLGARGTDLTARQLERFEMAASAAELALLLHFRNTGGDYVRAMFEGDRGVQLRNVTVVTGILAPLALNI
ncbi:MAG: polysulfide reductase NrfD, partial [Candidatus Eremiobacteraeota bacterium]|nr:polysulfide reductase NrfD [Candidatus Eremiobacteraeota bacterium]